ncbi:unnamed protein product [Ceratitis capitata]|uniref:(Mediterranean fruit fly) hypothetical protein n=1 Tax=Ceratitis capitata TaxID=7213 RepID=A0A811UKP5_CERCA|nr:unnamed protein product [Ceratitis capitata]
MPVLILIAFYMRMIGDTPRHHWVWELEPGIETYRSIFAIAGVTLQESRLPAAALAQHPLLFILLLSKWLPRSHHGKER